MMARHERCFYIFKSSNTQSVRQSLSFSALIHLIERLRLNYAKITCLPEKEIKAKDSLYKKERTIIIRNSL